LLDHIRNNNTPGLQYFIFSKDNVIHNFIGGFADIENQKKTDEKTTYNAFSVTKTFTALAVIQLAEKKILEIEDSAKKYLPDFPYTSEITIQQLLTHSAGVPNPIPLSWIHLMQEHPAFDGNRFFNQQFIKNNHVKFKPNEKFAYSNLGYVLLGKLIESVSGMTYEKYISDNILKRLDLLSNDLCFSINNNHAKGYHKRFSFSNALLTFLIDKSKYMGKAEGKWRSFKDYYVNGISYGGLIGTPNAFVKYIQELLKPDCKLITGHYKKLLLKENHTNDNKATGMCLSWFTGQLEGEKYFTHAGGGGGYYSEIRMYRDIDIGSVIMFNRTGMTDERFLDKLDKYFIKEKKANLQGKN
jgi:CubicO group peptidase (beta-lactamase class C family)